MSTVNSMLYPGDMLLSLQVCLKVRHRWFMPERGALQSWAAVSHPQPKTPPAQISSLCMWWSGCASVSTFPSSSNLECTLLVFIQTTRVRVMQMCSITHSLQKHERLICNNMWSLEVHSLKQTCQTLLSLNLLFHCFNDWVLSVDSGATVAAVCFRKVSREWPPIDRYL